MSHWQTQTKTNARQTLRSMASHLSAASIEAAGAGEFPTVLEGNEQEASQGGRSPATGAQALREHRTPSSNGRLMLDF